MTDDWPEAWIMLCIKAWQAYLQVKFYQPRICSHGEEPCSAWGRLSKDKSNNLQQQLKNLSLRVKIKMTYFYFTHYLGMMGLALSHILPAWCIFVRKDSIHENIVGIICQGHLHNLSIMPSIHLTVDNQIYETKPNTWSPDVEHANLVTFADVFLPTWRSSRVSDATICTYPDWKPATKKLPSLE